MYRSNLYRNFTKTISLKLQGNNKSKINSSVPSISNADSRHEPKHLFIKDQTEISKEIFA